MTIIFPIDIFDDISIETSRFNLAPNQADFTSIFTNTAQSQSHDAGRADRWEAVMVTHRLSPSDVKKLAARIVSLKGRINTVLIGNPDCKEPQTFVAGAGPLAGDNTQLAGDQNVLAGIGDFPGLGQVNGASQTGTTLQTNGWNANATILRAGDYIEVAMPTGVNQQLFMVLENVTTDGSGNATLTIEPAIRTSPQDNAFIKTTDTQFIGKLSTLFEGWDTNAQKTGVFSIPFEEDLI